MTLSDIALKRPVAAVVLSLVIILLGVVGYTFLGIRLYPAIDPPVITVSTSYTGANSEIIEKPTRKSTTARKASMELKASSPFLPGPKLAEVPLPLNLS